VEKFRTTRVGDWILTVAEPMVQIALIVVITAYLVDGSFNPFLYFRF
jgi:alginate O-acetyltransferase complex protein AlgI